VVWLLVVFLGVVGVCDDSLVVDWLGSGHSVLGGLVSEQSLVGCAQSSP
jgi:hypothetical protein